MQLPCKHQTGRSSRPKSPIGFMINKAETAVHHDTYEYAMRTLNDIQSSEEDSPHVILDKHAVLTLTACYARLYNQLYIEGKLKPLKNYIKKDRIH